MSHFKRGKKIGEWEGYTAYDVHYSRNGEYDPHVFEIELNSKEARLKNKINKMLIDRFHEEARIYTYYAGTGSTESAPMVWRHEPYDFKVIGRNFIIGKDNKVSDFTKLTDMQIDYMLNNGSLVDRSFIVEKGMATEEVMREIEETTYKMNPVVISFFAKFELKVVDFTLLFGKDTFGITRPCSEFSEKTCHLCNNSWEMVEKEFFG